MIIDPSGNVGIGETNPVDPLHIVADTGHDNIYLEENNGGEYWQMGIDGAGDLNFKEGGTQRITFHDGGQVGIGTDDLGGYKLVVNGHAAGTSWTNLSSRDYKKDIVAVPEMEAKLNTYTYKPEYGGDGTMGLGFISEEMPKEVLSKDGKGIDLYKLLALSIGAMKAQEKKIEELEARIALIEK